MAAPEAWSLGGGRSAFPEPGASQLTWQVGGDLGWGGCSQCAQRDSVPSQESLRLGNIYRSVFANTLKGA